MNDNINETKSGVLSRMERRMCRQTNPEKARKLPRFPRLKRGEINVRNNKILRTFSKTRGDFSLQSFPFRFLLPHFAS